MNAVRCPGRFQRFRDRAVSDGRHEVSPLAAVQPGNKVPFYKRDCPIVFDLNVEQVVQQVAVFGGGENDIPNRCFVFRSRLTGPMLVSVRHSAKQQSKIIASGSSGRMVNQPKHSGCGEPIFRIQKSQGFETR